jgi:hypothetical protein
MDEKTKYRAEVEARLAKFGETLHEITSKRELRDALKPTLNIDKTVSKHQQATAKLEILAAADSEGWQTAKSDLDTLMDDIDNDLRQALAHYK